MATLVEQVREHLRTLPAVRLAALFGSAARGTSHARSDLDLAVRLDPDSDSLELRRKIEVSLVRALGCTVDVIYMDEAPPLLRFEIARDGVLLVEGRPYEWADFKARAMLDWYDWKPYAERIHAAAVRRLREKVAIGPA